MAIEGKKRRLYRFQPSAGTRLLIVPVDDALIAGPVNGLENIDKNIDAIVRSGIDGLLCFPGFQRRHSDLLVGLPLVINLTASTTAICHTRKATVASVEHALACGAEAVAVHFNLGSQYEHEMLAITGQVARECEVLGVPLLVIAYPRGEGDGQTDENFEDLRLNEPCRYAEKVAHAVRVAVELGADMVKTQFPGSTDFMESVVRMAGSVPVLVAGGPLVPERNALDAATEALSGGAAGISYGRNVFGREDPGGFLRELRGVLTRFP